MHVQDLVLQAQEETYLKYTDSAKDFRAILLNYEDETFIKPILDAHSLAFFQQHVSLINDQLTRALVWGVLADMVRDGKLKATQYVDILEANIFVEQANDIVVNLIREPPFLLKPYIPEPHRLAVLGRYQAPRIHLISYIAHSTQSIGESNITCIQSLSLSRALSLSISLSHLPAYKRSPVFGNCPLGCSTCT